MKKHNLQLDIVKTIAMYLVVTGHLYGEIGELAIPINMCHLPALYFSSGFLGFYSLSNHAERSVLRNKLKSLGIPFLMWSGVAFAANVAMQILGGTATPASLELEFSDVFLHARSVWFLIQLLLAFIVLIGCKYLSGKLHINFFLLNWVAYGAIVATVPNTLLDTGKFKWLYPFFVAGFYIAKNKSSVQEFAGKRVLAIVSFLFPLLACGTLSENLYKKYTAFSYDSAADILGSVWCYCISFLGVVLLFTLAAVIAKLEAGEQIAEIGTYSIDIYVAHMFCIKFVPIMWLLKGKNQIIVTIFFFVYAFSIVIGIYLVAKYLLRKSKVYCLSVGRTSA